MTATTLEPARRGAAAANPVLVFGACALVGAGLWGAWLGWDPSNYTAPDEPYVPGPHLVAREVACAVSVGLATALLRARCEAEEIASELVGTSSDVEDLITWVSAGRPSETATPFLLRGWREKFGLDLVDLVEGRVQLQLVDEDPYLVIHRD